jgi:hypothetical protein
MIMMTGAAEVSMNNIAMNLFQVHPIPAMNNTY